MSTLPTRAAEIVLVGIYQGQNLYVRNPYDAASKTFCTLGVFVNGQSALSDIRASAFVIDLSGYQLNDSLRVRITHKDDCRPQVLNAQAIVTDPTFQFEQVRMESGVLVFRTFGEGGRLTYRVEREERGGWRPASTLMPARGNPDGSTYQVPLGHPPGTSRYRVWAADAAGNVYRSEVVSVAGEVAPLRFSPRRRVGDVLRLSRPVPYEVRGENGQMLLEGQGDTIDVSSLPTGRYELMAEGEVYEFRKK